MKSHGLRRAATPPTQQDFYRDVETWKGRKSRQIGMLTPLCN
jgi:hypothetical protein